MAAYTSSEAAQMLGIALITLRKLSTAFTAWLSPSATSNMIIDELSDRSYNDDDLYRLRYIIALLKQKRNYTWVRERLTVEFGAGDLLHSNNETQPHPPIADTQVIEPEPDMPDEMPWIATADRFAPNDTQPEDAPHGVEAEVIEPAASQATAPVTEQWVSEPEPDIPDEMPWTATADRFAPNDPQPEDAPHGVEAEVIEPESHVPPDITAMLTRMAELYQELLRNKEQEIAALRQALDITELSVANERRELEMVNRLAKIMERENQRLTTELENAQHQLGQSPPPRGLLARLFRGGEKEADAASHSQV
jgi:MerR HTH family regulatory protein